RLGQKALVWRFDPVFLGRGYDKSVHIRSSRKIAAHLEGYTQVCIFSFVDLYRKTLRNFPDVQEVSPEDQHELAAAFAAIASDHGMRLKSCAESRELDRYGIDSRGCIMKQDLEDLTGREYTIPGRKSKREACECLLENEIGAYNSCPHGCLYCYANTSPGKVALNFRNHDPESPLLIGHPGSEDEISVPRQKSYADKQLGLF
ncbi:MAG: DUF1848 family protein, partial [Spirochaetales bacterium]|nr:DUF1848 family protein [Spirochaetales bacterium]